MSRLIMFTFITLITFYKIRERTNRKVKGVGVGRGVEWESFCHAWIFSAVHLVSIFFIYVVIYFSATFWVYGLFSEKVFSYMDFFCSFRPITFLMDRPLSHFHFE
jgi:hypothetical protein